MNPVIKAALHHDSDRIAIMQKFLDQGNDVVSIHVYTKRLCVGCQTWTCANIYVVLIAGDSYFCDYCFDCIRDSIK
jgi:hypothetical protein